MFKPLLRTIPTVSGNVKLSCYITDIIQNNDIDTYETYIRVADLSPHQNNLYNQLIKVNLLDGSWEHDVKQFYYYYKDKFYENNIIFNKNDYQKLNKFGTNPLQPRNKDYEYGVKRLTYGQIGHQFEFYAPFYIDNADDLPEYFELRIELNKNIIKTIRINIKDNKESGKNYLKNYLTKYLNKINDDVIFCLNNSNQATYYGIDVQNGGLVEIKDNIISPIYNKQQTLNNFDYTICDGFQRNKLIMRQIIPISFVFNIDDILLKYEKKYYKDYPVKITGYYKIGNVKYDFYDFDINYINVTNTYLYYDDTNNIFTYKTSSNLMNRDFPCLKESRFTGYKYTNKLSPSYFRWKLAHSSDIHPYVTNMSFVFSDDKSFSYKYGEYPLILYNEKPAAILNEQNLLIPITESAKLQYNKSLDGKTNYTKFKNALNNYVSNWFELNHNPLNNIYSKPLWSEVKNNSTYYKGILYNLADINMNRETPVDINYFGVFVNPSMHMIDKSEETLMLAKSVIKYNTELCNVLVNNPLSKKQYTLNDGTVYTAYLPMYGNMALTDKLPNNALLMSDQILKRNDAGIYIKDQDYVKQNIYYKVSDILKIDGFSNIKFDEKKIFDSYEILPISHNENMLIKTEEGTHFIFEKEIEDNVDPLGSWLNENMYCSTSLNAEKQHIRDVYKDITADEKFSGKYDFFIKNKFISEYDLFEIPDINYTKLYNNLKNLNKYKYTVISNSNIDANTYFERRNVDTINDLNYIWTDNYSLTSLIDENILKTMKHKIFYAKFINKDFIKEWQHYIHKGICGKNHSEPGVGLYDIYYKERYMYTKNNILDNMYDVYRPVTDIINKEEFKDIETFLDALEDDGDKFILHCYNLVKNYETGKTDKVPVEVKLDLYYRKTFYALDTNLYNAMHITNISEDIIPLYLYRLNNQPEDYDISFKTVSSYSNYLTDMYTSSLYPLFNSVYKNAESKKHMLQLFDREIITKKDNTYYKYTDLSDMCMTEYDFKNGFTDFLYEFKFDEIIKLCKDINTAYENDILINWVNTVENIFYDNLFSILMTNADNNILFTFCDKYDIKFINDAEEISKVYHNIPLHEILIFFEEYIETYTDKFVTEKINDTLTVLYTYINNDEQIYKDILNIILEYTLTYIDIKLMFIKDYVNKDAERLKLYELYNAFDLKFNTYKTDEDTQYLDDFKIYMHTDKQTGKTYCFYYIECIFNNTNYAFNIINNTQNICTFEYINNEPLLIDKKINTGIIDKYFKYLCTFSNESMFNRYIANITTNIIPNHNILNLKYYPVVISSSENKNQNFLYEGLYYDKDDADKRVYDIKFIEKSKQKLTLNRYFNKISPILTKKYIINDVYNLMYKSIDKIICDNNIIKTNININRYDPILYINKWDSIYHTYDKLYEFNEFEYKHFNDNKYYNLEPYFEISVKKLLTYNELLEYEKDENIFKYFKNRLNNVIRYQFNESEMLFLYNKYKVNCSSEGMKLNTFNKQKLYALKYKFRLI